MKQKQQYIFLLLIFLTASAFLQQEKRKPTLWLIGDSTVDHGSGNNGLWGWGKYLPQFFDTSAISICNYAQGGTSARTFYTGGLWANNINKRGLWDTVASKMKQGDYLIIQFGLNDQHAVDDSARSRGTLKGISDSSVKIYNKVTKKEETVYTFGWYLRQYIQAAKAKGVEVIICSTVPRNEWIDGKLKRGEQGFANWAMEVAAQEKVGAIDLNNMIAEAYEAEGQAAVSQKYFTEKDKVHSTEQGAIVRASTVVKGIKQLPKSKLKTYLLP